MGEANERQVGGDHYKSNGYQHWDLANDLRLPYLAGVASKYIARWRKKNGQEDLAKCDHYLQKCIEVNLALLPVVNTHGKFWRFAMDNNMAIGDAEILYYIVQGDWAAARAALALLLAAEAGHDV